MDHSPSEIAEDDRLRSEYMRHLLDRATFQQPAASEAGVIPRVLVQFWDAPDGIPADVRACMESWAPVETSGFTRLLFDDTSARQFIDERLDPRHLAAFDACSHPAMRADYFRLCYVVRFGGVYVDADDEYQGADLEQFIRNDCLRVQALCYDIATGSMLDVVSAIGSGLGDGRIFYVNNNPLIAGPAHPVVADALERATQGLTQRSHVERDIQSLTGPGNLTAALVQHAAVLDALGAASDFQVLTDWGDVAVSKWPLAYREDGRNWRNWTRGEDIPQRDRTARA